MATTPHSRLPRLVEGINLRELPIGPAEAFVLSHVNGNTDESEIADEAGIAPEAVSATLEELARLGAICFDESARPESNRAPRPVHRVSGSMRIGPIVEAIGLGHALNYMMQVGRDQIARHEAELLAYAQAQMGELPWLKIYGTAPGKGAIVSFTMDGLHAHDIATVIDRSGVAVRAGHHCAQPLMERLGVTAVCRASFAMYNTKEEVDALVAALKRAHELFA